MAAGGLHRAATSNHWLRSGVPFVTFMLAGSYGISVVLQGRNDVRDARADVTDMRAPSRTQTARRRNRAFDLDDERERTMDALGVRDGARDVKMVPVPRPWQEPGANGRRWWGGCEAMAETRGVGRAEDGRDRDVRAGPSARRRARDATRRGDGPPGDDRHVAIELPSNDGAASARSGSIRASAPRPSLVVRVELLVAG